MEEEYKKILDYIWDCYSNDKFNDVEFNFYETRKEKGKHRAGIFIQDEKKYFFKIVHSDEYNNEDIILEKITPYFKIVPLYKQKILKDYVIGLYQYVDTTGINAFNYLRSNKVSLLDKEQVLNKFFESKFSFLINNMYLDKVTNNQKGDRWFWHRIKKGERVDKFYGNNGNKLLSDIKEFYPEGLNNMKDFLNNIYPYLESKHNTIFSYSHGDFHDFNFSLEGLFWDIDTFDYNPIVNDFAVFYWHFYAREDSLIYKYSPWLTLYMNNELTKEELKQVRTLKEKIILKWYSVIYDAFKKENILYELNNEFIFKLFCRMFLIDDVTKYEVVDKEKVYKFFDYIIQNKDKDLKDVLFNSEITFEYYNYL